jgi:hypothetical protein
MYVASGIPDRYLSAALPPYRAYPFLPSPTTVPPRHHLRSYVFPFLSQQISIQTDPQLPILQPNITITITITINNTLTSTWHITSLAILSKYLTCAAHSSQFLHLTDALSPLQL